MKSANIRKIRGFTAFCVSFRGHFCVYFLMLILTQKMMEILTKTVPGILMQMMNVFDVNLRDVPGARYTYDGLPAAGLAGRSPDHL
jgi:hypothetical protein